jgi:Na+-transporting NADH:ubiquinone oxidoreductase subunit NqrF
MAFRHLVGVSVVAAAFLFGCGQGTERYVETAKVKKNPSETLTMFAGEDKFELRMLSTQDKDITKSMMTSGSVSCSDCSVNVAGGTADCGACSHECDSPQHPVDQQIE